MAKKIGLLIIVLMLAVAAYFGLRSYNLSNNTSSKMMQVFVDELIAGETESTYDRLSSGAKANWSSSDWAERVGIFKDCAQPQLISQESIDDTFNTYPEDGDPRRYKYLFNIDGRDYLVTVIMYEYNDAWQVDDLQGEYK